MNQRTIHNLTWLPIFIVGIASVGLGGLWCLHPEPWLLDQLPNEILLQTKFSELFSANINVHLPDYLIVIYRFFGWWVSLIGLLRIGYTYVTRLGTQISRLIIQSTYFIGLIGIGVILYIFIPSSPFVYLNLFLWLMWFISVYSGIKLNQYDQ